MHNFRLCLIPRDTCQVNWLHGISSKPPTTSRARTFVHPRPHPVTAASECLTVINRLRLTHAPPGGTEVLSPSRRGETEARGAQMMWSRPHKGLCGRAGNGTHFSRVPTQSLNFMLPPVEASRGNFPPVLRWGPGLLCGTSRGVTHKRLIKAS